MHRIRAETLVLSGDDDRLVPVANARILASRIPGARLEILPGGGHLLLFDQADVVAPILTRFLRGDQSSSSMSSASPSLRTRFQ